MRYTFTDELWAAFHPLVRQAKRNRQGPAPKVPDRDFFEGLLDLARTGIPWRGLPAAFGRWDAVYNRFRRWATSGSLRKLFDLLTDSPQFDGVRRVFVDSTIIRAHQHAAGARRKKKRSSGRPRATRSAGAAAA